MNDIILYGDNMKINNKEFLNYMVAKETSNISFIKAIKINKKSISIKLNNDSEKFVFNNFFTKRFDRIFTYPQNRNTLRDR